MTLAPGARLGPYEILAAIGAGGMGEVYKARDTRLDRTVAINVLPVSAQHHSPFRSAVHSFNPPGAMPCLTTRVNRPHPARRT
jgi:serine/threonine protein kinase